MSPICLTLSSIWGWKLHQHTKGTTRKQTWESAGCSTLLVFYTGIQQTHPPDSKDAAEVVHDAVEFVLQLLEEVASLHVELEEDKWDEYRSHVIVAQSQQ